MSYRFVTLLLTFLAVAEAGTLSVDIFSTVGAGSNILGAIDLMTNGLA